MFYVTALMLCLGLGDDQCGMYRYDGPWIAGATHEACGEAFKQYARQETRYFPHVRITGFKCERAT